MIEPPLCRWCGVGIDNLDEEGLRGRRWFSRDERENYCPESWNARHAAQHTPAMVIVCLDLPDGLEVHHWHMLCDLLIKGAIRR